MTAAGDPDLSSRVSVLLLQGRLKASLQPARGLLGPAMALLAVVALLALLAARVGAAKGITPGALRGATRRSSARRQGRNL